MSASGVQLPGKGGCPRALDEAAKLTEQVNEVQSTWWYTNPRTQQPVQFQCVLSGDAKAMVAGHHLEKAKCWSCALDTKDPEALAPQI